VWRVTTVAESSLYGRVGGVAARTLAVFNVPEGEKEEEVLGGFAAPKDEMAEGDNATVGR
jgi:hypothetical protein